MDTTYLGKNNLPVDHSLKIREINQGGWQDRTTGTHRSQHSISPHPSLLLIIGGDTLDVRLQSIISWRKASQVNLRLGSEFIVLPHHFAQQLGTDNVH
ncbi:hypothetical protein NQZ68_031482 [Dissostichus eleginoides]|nr:hypothetical protein NQZ68_031482 [Dissostichus eleginoides]